MAKITKRTVDALKPGEIAWDSEIKGFGVRCQRKTKTYVLKFRAGNRQRWLTIGRHGSPWTLDKARVETKHLIGMVADGKDPATVRDTLKGQPSVKDLCKRFLENYAAEHKRPSSLYNDQANIQNHVVPLLGKFHVADVTRVDIDRFKRAVKDGKTAKDVKIGPRRRVIVTGGPGAANKCLALLSKMFNMAERWDLRPDGTNPCRHVEKYRSQLHERFLSEKELARLAEVLATNKGDGAETPFVLAAICLLVFTGARMGEILSLKWAHVDFDHAMLFLSESKTGKKVIYLSAPALEVLANIPRIESNPFVICGEKDGAHLVNLQKPWTRIRKQAGLGDVRIHDLRHSFASIAASSGLSLPVIGKLLGHTQAATTERYAHLAADPLQAANEAIGQHIAAIIRGEGAEVVDQAPERIVLDH